MTNRQVAIKKLPDCFDKNSRMRFLREIKALVETPGHLRLILDLSSVRQLNPELIDALVECVDRVERADSELIIVGASPEAEVVLELTQLTSIINMFPSVAEAAIGFQLPDVYPLKHDSSGLHSRVGTA